MSVNSVAVSKLGEIKYNTVLMEQRGRQLLPLNSSQEMKKIPLIENDHHITELRAMTLFGRS